MDSFAATPRPAPRWLHAWAVLTALATALLLAAGGVVTTFRVGMADPVWPTAPWYLFFISWREPSAGFLIEHTHRLAGYIVGCCVIVLAAGLWLSHTARWLKRLGVIALLCVIAQGVLGGFRVKLNVWAGTDLAAVHACFAQVVFCLLVGLAVLTAPPPAIQLSWDEARRFLRLACLLVVLLLVQLVWGVLVRHHHGTIAQRLHFLTAFAVVALTAWLTRAAGESPATTSLLGRPLAVLGLLLLVQVGLGVEAWIGKFAGVELPEAQLVTISQAVVRTAHLLVGSWVLAAAVVLVLRVSRAAPGSREAVHSPQAEAFHTPHAALRTREPSAAGVTTTNGAQREGTA